MGSMAGGHAGQDDAAGLGGGHECKGDAEVQIFEWSTAALKDSTRHKFETAADFDLLRVEGTQS